MSSGTPRHTKSRSEESFFRLTAYVDWEKVEEAILRELRALGLNMLALILAVIGVPLFVAGSWLVTWMDQCRDAAVRALEPEKMPWMK